jgi:ribosomal protein S18 acetylase RimI-like enzyme
MIQIIPAQSGEALEYLITLAGEYVAWMLAEVQSHYPQMDINEMSSAHTYDDIRKKFPGDHIPPDGCLLIAKNDDQVCGCIALGKLEAGICELRTLYVRPTCRGTGLGKQLVKAALNQAHQFGYSMVRLDTLEFMESAQSLYRSFGFYSIQPYLDMSSGLKQHIHFYELQLPNG